ncbi:hypothetical protein DFH28DRAFT_1081843 [Melampsora americana]|nr:hypothetical protein DFH28DRAFT_1081843 [Melampsora americana]
MICIGRSNIRISKNSQVDKWHPTTPNLQHHSSQTSHGPIHEVEPNYHSMLDNPILTPNTSQSKLRPQSSVLNSGHILGDPVAIFNLITTIGGQFGLTPSQLCKVDKVFKQPNDCQIALLCFLTSLFSNGQHDVTVDSLENLVILMKPNTTVIDQDLPPHICSNNLAAENTVQKVIKEIEKSERSKFQNGLLENIKDPKINTLASTLFKTTSKDMIWNAMDIADKSRTALLRLEGTIYHLLSKISIKPRTSEKEKVEQSMWVRVDERLFWNAKLFTGKQTYEQVKQSNIICMGTPELLSQWILKGEPNLDLH